MTSHKFRQNSAAKTSEPRTIMFHLEDGIFHIVLGEKCNKKGIFLIWIFGDIICSRLIKGEPSLL
jgi:hypothetical protein